jgi:diguanylate cyclase (GGDEF)-like protein
MTESLSQAEVVSLTQIGNRRYLLRRLNAALSAGHLFGLLFLDLTRFKPFNDRHGHHLGDEALRIVGQRLRATKRDDDAVARVGGDEFVLLLAGLADRTALLARASAEADHLCEPMHVAGRIVEIGVNIGGALFPQDGRGEIALLDAADRNMYEAKRAGVLFWTEGHPGGSTESV